MSQKPEQKFAVGERVFAGFLSYDFGTITHVKWMFHHRFSIWTWGYKIRFEGKGSGLVLEYLPEGYLQKLDAQGNVPKYKYVIAFPDQTFFQSKESQTRGPRDSAQTFGSRREAWHVLRECDWAIELEAKMIQITE